MVSMYLNSLNSTCSNRGDLLSRHRALVTRYLLQRYRVNRLSDTFKKFYGRYTDLVGQYEKNVRQMSFDSISKKIVFKGKLVFFKENFWEGRIYCYANFSIAPGRNFRVVTKVFLGGAISLRGRPLSFSGRKQELNNENLSR